MGKTKPLWSAQDCLRCVGLDKAAASCRTPKRKQACALHIGQTALTRRCKGLSLFSPTLRPIRGGWLRGFCSQTRLLPGASAWLLTYRPLQGGLPSIGGPTRGDSPEGAVVCCLTRFGRPSGLLLANRFLGASALAINTFRPIRGGAFTPSANTFLISPMISMMRCSFFRISSASCSGGRCSKSSLALGFLMSRLTETRPSIVRTILWPDFPGAARSPSAFSTTSRQVVELLELHRLRLGVILPPFG